MKEGISQRCRRAAWNWKGMQTTARMTSAAAKLAMYMLMTVRIRRPVTEYEKGESCFSLHRGACYNDPFGVRREIGGRICCALSHYVGT